MKLSSFRLKWRMLTIIIAASLVLLVCLWLTQYTLCYNIHKYSQKLVLISKAKEVTASIDSDIEARINNCSIRYELSFILIQPDGKIATTAYTQTSYISKLSKASLLSKAELAKSSEKGHFYQTVVQEDKLMADEKFYPESLIYVTTIKDANGAEFTLIAEKTVTSIESSIKIVQAQLLIVTAFIIIYGFITTIILSLRVAKPIESVTLSAVDFARGKKGVEFKGSGYYEIEKLRDTLNYASNEIYKSDSYRRELLTNVSHDLRTPLTLINGFAQLMKDYPLEITEQNIQVIIDETERMTTLVNDTLSLTLIEEGKDILSLKEFDIVPLLKGIVSRFSLILEGQGFVLDFHHEEKAHILADEIKISQVIYNLISNAVNYAGADKKIIVKQYTKDKMITVEVIDHGKGISVDEIAQIWDRYYKNEKSHRRFHIGSGLGLSIVKSIISIHPGGVYGVKSSPNNGSKFYFSLPKL